MARSPEGRRQPGGREPAPGALALVQDFVNTLNIEAGTDALLRADEASAWLVEAGLLSAGIVIDEVDAAELRGARESTRELLASHRSVAVPAGAAANLARLARRARPRLTFDGGVIAIRAVGNDVDAAITTILLAIAEASTIGLLGRFKVCANDGCRWAFYDHSPNARSRWCAPDLCGNKAYTRAYRARRSAAERSGEG